MSLTLLEAAKAKLEGKRVEYRYGDGWIEWTGDWWPSPSVADWNFRIAPEPKKKVKLFAFIDIRGELRLLKGGSVLFNCAIKEEWVRASSEDKEVEIETL